MDSEDSWNDQVRLPDSNDDDDDDVSSLLLSLSPIPYWTTEMGGCEGMQLVVVGMETDKDKSLNNIMTTTTTTQIVVDPYQVYQILQQHEHDEERFPIEGIVTPIGNVTTSCWDDD